MYCYDLDCGPKNTLFGVLSMIGFGDPGVSYVSHLGGVAAGMVAGALFKYITRPKDVGSLLH